MKLGPRENLCDEYGYIWEEEDYVGDRLKSSLTAARVTGRCSRFGRYDVAVISSLEKFLTFIAFLDTELERKINLHEKKTNDKITNNEKQGETRSCIRM